MHIEAQGIILYPLELKALVKFCAKDAENPLSVVHFRTEKDHLIAYSTNGSRALQAKGEAHQGATEGEWTVSRQFLSKVLTALESGQFAALQVSAASLHGAVIRDASTLEEVCEVTWPTDAASTQTTFPVDLCRRVILLPVTERPIRCVSINAEYLADLTIVAKAAGSMCLDMYPGRTRRDPLVFRINTLDELDTEWTGCVAPLADQISSEEEGKPDDKTPEPPRGIFEPDAMIDVVDENGEVHTHKLYDFERILEEKKRKKRGAKQSDKQPELEFNEALDKNEGEEDE